MNRIVVGTSGCRLISKYGRTAFSSRAQNFVITASVESVVQFLLVATLLLLNVLIVASVMLHYFPSYPYCFSL
jgi:hypothetical protein